MNSKSLKKGVVFFPSVRKMKGNPYWSILAEELENSGVYVEKQNPNTFDAKWLRLNRKKLNILHIHFCNLFYQNRNDQASFSRVFLFILNIIYARFLGYRVIYTLHNLKPTYWLNPNWVDSLGHIIPIILSNYVIVHCEEAQRIIAKKYRRIKNVVVVPHPNYIDYYENRISKRIARQKLHITEPDLVVFTFLGGIRPNKGIENLIRAFRKLKNPNFRLVIAGAVNKPVSYTQYLQALAGADKRVSFHLKWIPDDEIQVFLKSADIVVLPFTNIHVSGSAILALSFGRPVIAPRMGCLINLIEPDAGWLYPPGDTEKLSEIMKIVANLDLKKFNKQAINKVLPFTKNNFVEQTQNIYWN